MSQPDCPNWEYTDFQNYDAIIKKELTAILKSLRTGKVDTSEESTDTRTFHYRLFRNLTPKETPYYAGNYRGSSYRCLEFYEVGVSGDPRVGFPPNRVSSEINLLAQLIKSSLAGLYVGFQLPNMQIPLQEKIKYAIAVACQIFETFLRIHPYANGNGHTARYCLWTILGRFNVWPIRWPIHPRPSPPYLDLIIQHRNGDKEPLERFVLQCCIMDTN